MTLTTTYTFHGLTIELHEDKTTTTAPHPTIAMSTTGLPILGGGAFVDYGNGPGSLLTAAFPASPTGTDWEARAKDHGQSSPATVTAFAIGVTRSFLAARGLTVVRFRADSYPVVPHPGVDCRAEDGPALVGGGAETHWQGAGSLLTASVPVNASGTAAGPYLWTARGKDHLVP